MVRISLQEQYENKDVIQQIYILKDEVNGATGTAEDAKATADDALSKVSAAYAQSNQAMAQATLAKETADEAQADATQALADAEQAQTDADNAVASGSVIVDAVSAKLRLVKVSGESEDSVIPIASASQTGMMNAQTFKGLSDLGNRVTALENKATTVYVTFPSDSPSQTEITSAFTSAAGRAPTAGDYATDISRGLTYGYDGSTWVQAGGSTVPAFTNTEAGLIKGNTAEGTVFAEADGTGSVNGWDELKQSVADNGTAIEQNASAVSALTTRVDTLESAQWEELDVSSLPTDFQAGDVLMLEMKLSLTYGYAVADWDAQLKADRVYTSGSDGCRQIVVVTLRTRQVSCYQPVATSCLAGRYVRECFIGTLRSTTAWNSSASTEALLNLTNVMFNGNGSVTADLQITKATLPEYVSRILRLRPN